MVKPNKMILFWIWFLWSDPCFARRTSSPSLLGGCSTPAAFGMPSDLNSSSDDQKVQRQVLGSPVCQYLELMIPTSLEGQPRQAISVEDLTSKLKSMLAESGMKDGVVNVISRHTTTAITINERESRLAQDMQEYFLKLAPPDERSSAETAQQGVTYYHNDIDQRPDSAEEAQRCRDNGWNIDDSQSLQAWRDQEPINAHSHLLSMLLGSSESIPVVDGEMVIGQWQSILLVDLDGPRDRTVGVQFLGYQYPEE
uniref:Secondary thiamine-phosphate synthase enzyme n=1 Tax=Attheya septentrionalis TaxID=420275 RepID=A0A7S2XRV4_9STRA|mmetsp:Transcript_3874/g.6993  ORF Transcript_3874/g.6993 Transcript_3874/m.6993 type:complete len:254 (+) Transcript_3874:160-921(+)|eukprot:CAMPEP_0198294436 /NCGR_PEP_ID=MMETSP1449-20131203/22294_1 /TAXON_ID=420275 /ORGANISM="Attheya septentrionalis, Strain CCMP2084" /LENGTH=253 /DNA_ID=CAMNT_0043994387 /DNA_START=111 /DNA_END=872 /DNA_ORIENTATION=+